MLRTAPETADHAPFARACFPMVPYANRIVDGRFCFGGRRVSIPPNWEGARHPLHGQGWRKQWRITARTETAAEFELEGGDDEWPWRYRARERFELFPNAAMITLELLNLAGSAMPGILGLHPYFPDAANARLHAEVPWVWNIDHEFLPTERISTPEQWLFHPGRRVNTAFLDHCFEAWNGQAEIHWPDRRIKMVARNCAYLHIYAPVHGEFFCVEPQTAAAGALNRDGNEKIALEPGESIAVSLVLEAGEQLCT